MNAKEAYARLLVLKYVASMVSDGEIKFILPRKYVTEDVKGLISGLYVEEDSTLVLTNPVGAMMRLMDVEPFSYTYEKYIKKYSFPEKLFILNNMGKWVTNAMYFLRRRGDEVYVGEGWYKLLNEEDVTKNIKRYELERDGRRFVILFQKFEDRPPLRGLLFNKEDIVEELENYLIDAVRLAVLAHKKFYPLRNAVGTVYAKGKRYELWKIVERNPVLDIRKDLMKVSRYDEEKRVIVSKYIDSSNYPEKTFMDLLNHYLEDRSFETLSQDDFDNYVTQLLFEEEIEQGGAV